VVKADSKTFYLVNGAIAPGTQINGLTRWNADEDMWTAMEAPALVRVHTLCGYVDGMKGLWIFTCGQLC
jgi:hypothetical protein